MPVTTNNTIYTAQVVFDMPVHQRFTYRIPGHLEGSVVPGQRVKVSFGRRFMTGYVVAKERTGSSLQLKDISAFVDEQPMITPELLALGCWVAKEYGCSEGEALAAFLSPRLSLKRKHENLPAPASIQSAQSRLLLTHDQKIIFDDIESAINAHKSKTFLIHGITGSGKTEIYLHTIASVLDKGKQALYLVPEITMTPLFIGQLTRRFGNTVALWHSRLSVREKLATWHNVLNGTVQVVIGARSAVFMPFKQIGVIIIDEEHDDSYKQDQKPFYHARAVSLRRAEQHHAVVVLGSATPSVESYTDAINGRYVLHTLTRRIDNRPLPDVKLIDLGGKKIGRMPDIFSEELLQGIRRRLARREQVILFINRRGYAPFIRCGVCGWVSTCSQCSVSLVYHRKAVEKKAEGQHEDLFVREKEHVYAHKLSDRPDSAHCTERLICHYCGTVTHLPENCLSCGQKKLRLAGIGTQKVESEIKRLFPTARIARLDRDTASHKDFYSNVYHNFSRENIDILIGTQIVAKGFDFPRVTLVGIIEADTALHVPDFRANERTFQLITQVAGRAGRSSLGGEVIVQTFYPEHYAMQAASRHNYEEFYRQEMVIRNELRYPPAKRLMSLTFRGRNEKTVQSECEKTAGWLNAQNVSSCELLGPAPALRPMLHGKHRWQIVLKGDTDACRVILEKITGQKIRSDVLLSAEIDPVSIM